MTLSHAAILYFNGRAEAAKKRMQKLKVAGLIGERSRKAYEPSILFLTREGFGAIQERGLLNGLPILTWPSLERRLQVSDLTLRHELEVMDVKAALYAAVGKESAFDVAEFSTWPLLFQFRASPDGRSDILVKPDGFIRIHEQDGQSIFEHAFFLEVDRSSETVDTLARRALCYLNYYQRGGLAERFGHPRSAYKDFPFRVLMVFKTAERRNNITERLLTQDPPILSQVWLSTLKQVLADPLGPIWIRPRDYREATAGTTYAVVPSGIPNVYRRQQDREQFIESAVQTHCLLAPARSDIPTTTSD
jgi:Replication-relaxation